MGFLLYHVVANVAFKHRLRDIRSLTQDLARSCPRHLLPIRRCLTKKYQDSNILLRRWKSFILLFYIYVFWLSVFSFTLTFCPFILDSKYSEHILITCSDYTKNSTVLLLRTCGCCLLGFLSRLCTLKEELLSLYF